MSAAQKPDYQGLWDQFKKDYSKVYHNGDEEAKRFNVFKANVDIIEEHNAKKLSYWLGVNDFADQTWEEFSKTHLGYNNADKQSSLAKLPFPRPAKKLVEAGMILQQFMRRPQVL